MNDKERECYMSTRQALLLMIDGIERLLDIEPRTAELRKEKKRENYRKKQES